MEDDPVRCGIRAFDSVFGGFVPGRINLLIGRCDLNFMILDRLSVAHASCGGTVYYVDGAMRCNPFSMARVLRSRRSDPSGPLSRILIARAFTAHQMDALVREALPAVRPAPSLAIVSGLDSLLSDAEVKDDEAAGMLGNCAASLEAIAALGPAVVVAATGGARGADLLRVIGPMAEKWASLKERPGKRVRIVVKEGRWTDFVPVPPFQTILDDFRGVEA